MYINEIIEGTYKNLKSEFTENLQGFLDPGRAKYLDERDQGAIGLSTQSCNNHLGELMRR